MIIDPDFTMIYTRRVIDGVLVRAAWSPAVNAQDWDAEDVLQLMDYITKINGHEE
jgi:hypothetical protein